MTRVLVIGAGIAGLWTAVRAADAGCEVELVTKAGLGAGSTAYAQGGIAAALFPDDSADRHAADTLAAGAGLCDPRAVRVLCEEGPARVRDLIRFGVEFDRNGEGLARGLEAAHSRARILHAGGDATGAEIERALVATVRRRAVAIHEHATLVDLLVEHGRAVGAVVLDAGGERAEYRADVVVLATGGAGRLFRHTTNPDVATGDGVAAAWRAGAEVADLEFVQFHPTALAAPGTPLVSEAVRGEGAVLRDATGARFMTAIDPRGELAPRDVVARAVWRRMAEQDGAPVLLDATGLEAEDPGFLARRFPGIDRAVRDAGFDWAVAPVPITPAAHYAMGGVTTDLWGRTTLAGLLAVGEVARTGVHGANRLASNSLLEAAVFAERAAAAIAGDAPARASSFRPVAPRPADASVDDARPLVDREALQALMWDRVGLERDAAGLAEASSLLAGWRAPDPVDRRTAEDRNLLDLARLTTAAALARRESVGAHFRSDASAAASVHPAPAAADLARPDREAA
ncbi:L-aspartate oxidase [Agromyces sp. MMS24-JH15]|uniref:L-aspartate oxidase n=1 Tax=Agromyces sp. MMS24-JH15 TaxID=3243765 RepID=UPI0037487338